LIAQLHRLRRQVRNANLNHDAEVSLNSLLREAAKLLQRATLPGRPGVEGSISATTPTQLLELFVRRSRYYSKELGKWQADRLLAEGYELIAQLEGQTAAH
jgi:hypothetical protein